MGLNRLQQEIVDRAKEYTYFRNKSPHHVTDVSQLNKFELMEAVCDCFDVIEEVNKSLSYVDAAHMTRAKSVAEEFLLGKED